MDSLVTAGAGFLLAVLWFDLMHDVQVRGHRGGDLPEAALASIAGYYRRVTTDAFPMNRLVALAMLVTLGAIVGQLVGDETPNWVAIASLAGAASAIGLAGVHTVPLAVRLGSRSDPIDEQSRLARSVFRDHVFCISIIVPLLLMQLVWA